MRQYAELVRNFVSEFLAPYAGRFQMDYASFRPLEEKGRDLPLHKRNDLLHVDAFPSRPTRGARILRVFTNVNPAKDRVWVVAERFPDLASRFAAPAGLQKYARPAGAWSGLKRGLSRVGLPIPNRSPYDEFMLHFHDWLKENADFQSPKEGKQQVAFPPMATWLVYTDGVPHAALSGQFAMEQTFLVPVEALVAPQVSPIRRARKVGGKSDELERNCPRCSPGQVLPGSKICEDGTRERMCMENPLKLKRIHHVEFWVGNARQAAFFYRKGFGFSQVAYSGLETGQRQRTSYAMSQGKANFVLTTPLTPDDPAAEHIKKHGDGVRDIALEVADADQAFEEAVRRGAKPAEEPHDVGDECGAIRRAAVHTYGDTIHSLISYKDYKGPFLPGFAAAPVEGDDCGILRDRSHRGQC